MKYNLELWKRLEKTDPKHTKKAKIGGMSITAVAPHYQILNATREFGVYGVTRGFKSIELDYNLIEKYDLIVFRGCFFSPLGECQVINSSKMYMDRKKEMVDTDFAKKIETDALTKVLSKMGFNADIFMGRFDDTKYVNDMKREFNEKPTIEDSKLNNSDGWTTAQIAAVKSKYKLNAKQLDILNKIA